MTAEELAAALVVDTYALQAVMRKRAMTAAELAEATGLGLGKTRRLIQALKLTGLLLEESAACGSKVLRVFRLRYSQEGR